MQNIAVILEARTQSKRLKNKILKVGQILHVRVFDK